MNRKKSAALMCAVAVFFGAFALLSGCADSQDTPGRGRSVPGGGTVDDYFDDSVITYEVGASYTF